MLGMLIMAFLLLSKNLMLLSLVDYFGAKDHLEEISEKEVKELERKGLSQP